ncbi:MAG TPA: tetratricopeptide repeat protein [Planktothrix sp.]
MTLIEKTWDALRQEAEDSLSQEDFRTAESSLRDALKRAHEFHEDDPKVIYTLERLGDVNVKLGKNTDAEIFYRQCLAKRQKVKGDSHLSLTDCLSKLAELAYEQCNYKQAEKDYSRALAIYESSLGNTHPAVGFTASKLARTFMAQEKFPGAEAYYDKALEITSTAFGKDNAGVIAILDEYLDFLAMSGKTEKFNKLSESYQRTTNS